MFILLYYLGSGNSAKVRSGHESYQILQFSFSFANAYNVALFGATKRVLCTLLRMCIHHLLSDETRQFVSRGPSVKVKRTYQSRVPYRNSVSFLNVYKRPLLRICRIYIQLCVPT